MLMGVRREMKVCSEVKDLELGSQVRFVFNSAIQHVKMAAEVLSVET